MNSKCESIPQEGVCTLDGRIARGGNQHCACKADFCDRGTCSNAISVAWQRTSVLSKPIRCQPVHDHVQFIRLLCRMLSTSRPNSLYHIYVVCQLSGYDMCECYRRHKREQVLYYWLLIPYAGFPVAPNNFAESEFQRFILWVCFNVGLPIQSPNFTKIY